MFRKFSEINEFRITEKSVYLLIHQKGPIVKSEILQELGGSLTNINRFISELEKEELIIGSKGSGRKAGEYSINPDAVYAVGAYLNGDVLGMGLCDISGQVHDYEEVLYSDYSTPENAADFFEEVYKDLSSKVSSSKLLGTGLGIVGPLDIGCKTILIPEQLPKWRNVSFVQMLEDKINSSVILDYFAETALIGELLFGHHDLKKDIGLLWLDNGIGSALYNRGKSSLNHRDQSSLLCHQVVNFKGNPCVCGRNGCLLTYGTIPSLMRSLNPFIKFDEMMKVENEKRFQHDPWNFSSVLHIISQTINTEHNSPQINYVLEEMKEAYLAALGNFIYLLRPEELVFCGRLAREYQDLFKDILKKIDQYTGYFPEMKIITSWIDLDSKKMIQGGAALVFNKYMNFSV